MAKSSATIQHDAKRASRNRVNTARWRERKAIRDQSIVDDVNFNREKLNLPPVTLNLKHEYTMKGKPRPNYDPPPEVKARMSAMELSKWRAKQRRLRKAETQRNNRLRKKELLKSIKEELPELKSKVEEINKDAQILCEIKGIILVAKEDLAATQVEKSQDSESTAKETIVKVDTPADSSSTAIAKTDDHFIKTSTHVDIYQDFKPAASAKTVDDDMYADVHEDPSQAFNSITNAKAEDCTKTQDPTPSNPIPLADDDFSIADDLDLGIDEDLFQDGSNGITIPDPNLEQYEMAITEEFDMDKVFD